MCSWGRTTSGGMMKLCTFVDVLLEVYHAKFHLHVMSILRASMVHSISYSLTVAYE
jgi:hypothetical protein